MFLTYTASVLASSSANAAGVSSGRMYVMVREPEAFKKIQNRPESTTLQNR
jgi:hypothetical protein